MLDLGTGLDQERIALSDKERSTHIHIMGATQSGKSKLIEYMIRQDIERRRGLCLIDPHGYLSDAIERWCASRALGRSRKIHIIKPGADGWAPGFNPLNVREGEATSVRVHAMVAACSQVWGGEDLSQTPRLKKVLRAVFFLLAAKKLTIPDALFFLKASDPEGTRQALADQLADPTFAFVWGELNGLRPKEFAEYTESTVSRLTDLLDTPAVRLMLGQQNNVIDFRKAMDGDEVVIVNLGSRGAFDYENARVIGSLIINDLFLTSLGRDERAAKRHPFSLYIDEAYDFLSGNVERILDQCSKFGLHVVLAHQRIQQLKMRGEGIYSAVMANARTKIVFGGLPDDDATIMVRELLRDQVDLEQPKHSLDKPIVVGDAPHWFESLGWSDTIQRSQTRTVTSGSAEQRGESKNTALGHRILDTTLQEVPVSLSLGAGSMQVSSVSNSRSEAESNAAARTVSQQWTEGRVPIYEERPTAVYSLEEQLHLGTVKLRRLPQQHALVKRREHPAQEVRVPTIAPPMAGSSLVGRFKEGVLRASPFVTTVEAAEEEYALRQKTISGLQSPPPIVPEPALSDVDPFWSDEP